MDVLLLRAIRQYLLGMCTTVSRPFVCKIQRFSRAMLLPRITQPDNDLPCPVKITSTTATVLVSRAHGPSHHGHTLHNKLRRKSFLSCKTRGRTRGPKFTVISIHNIKAYFVWKRGSQRRGELPSFLLWLRDCVLCYYKYRKTITPTLAVCISRKTALKIIYLPPPSELVTHRSSCALLFEAWYGWVVMRSK